MGMAEWGTAVSTADSDGMNLNRGNLARTSVPRVRARGHLV